MTDLILASTTDAAETVAATVEGRDTFIVKPEHAEISEDGKTRTDAVEDENSSRAQYLRVLEAAERQAAEDLAALEPLNQESAQAQAELLGEGEQEGEQSESAAPKQSVARARLAELEERYPGTETLAISAARALRPEVLSVLDKSPYGADVLREISLNPQALQRMVNDYSPAEQATMLASRMWELQEQSAQKGASNAAPGKPRSEFRPIKPVAGGLRSTVPLDEADYQTYRAEREKQIRARRGR